MRVWSRRFSRATRRPRDGTKLGTIDIDDRLSEGLRGFLRQIVADASLDEPVFVVPREFSRVGSTIRMRCAIGVAFQRDRRHGNVRGSSEALFECVVFGFAFGEAESPTIIVNYDGNIVRVIERPGAALERVVVEVPFRRRGLPDKFREITPVLVITEHTAMRREVVLIPPLVFSLR